MSKKKKRKKRSNSTPGKSPEPQSQGISKDPFIPDMDIGDEEMMDALREMQKEKPEMVANIFSELDSWRTEFVSEHGREPSEEDLLKIFDDEDEDFDDLADADLDWEDHQVPEICRICAWCLKELEDEEERFSFGVKTKFEVTPSEDPTQPLTLSLSNGKLVNAIISTPDSPARQDGYQLLVMCCSESCINEAQKALQKEMDIDKTITLN